MTKYFLVAAAVAAIGFTGLAYAGEATKGSGTTTTGPAAMTDTEMDKVTAGFGFVEVPEAASRNGFLVNQNLLPPGPCAEHCIGLDRALDRAAQPARD
jgi:hypothetical protein